MEIESLRVDMEIKPLRVEFQVDSAWKKTKSSTSKLENRAFEARVLRGKSSLLNSRLDMAKRAGRVVFGSRVKRVTGQNGSF